MPSFLLASAAFGLALAAPAPVPQSIDFDLAYALPNPTYTESQGVTAQTVTYNPTTVFSAAIQQITSTQTDDAGVSIAPEDAVKKRAAATSCAAQPSGYGPKPSPDSASAFLGYAPFASAASAAPIPSGYVQSFVNAQASNNAYGYLGYTTLTSYNSAACAAKCNAISGCISFNVYFERDPIKDPGPGCKNPASTTNIKCVFWGGPVTSDNAVNRGQYRNDFQVVIAGSNGYINSSVASPAGYGAPVPLGNAAIDAPFDTYGYNSFMGSAIFIGAFNAQLCADACTTKSNYARQHPPTDGSPVQTCQFFNTYLLYINQTSNVQGQYCAMYSETWPSSYATNVGQYRGNDHFMIQYSFAYSNKTDPGKADPAAAVYQARTDILWPGNSALPYCSSILGYTTPLTTVTSTATTTLPGATSIVQTTTTVSQTEIAYVKRDDATATPILTVSAGTMIKIAPTSTGDFRSQARRLSRP